MHINIYMHTHTHQTMVRQTNKTDRQTEHRQTDEIKGMCARKSCTRTPRNRAPPTLSTSSKSRPRRTGMPTSAVPAPPIGSRRRPKASETKKSKFAQNSCPRAC